MPYRAAELAVYPTNLFGARKDGPLFPPFPAPVNYMLGGPFASCNHKLCLFPFSFIKEEEEVTLSFLRVVLESLPILYYLNIFQPLFLLPLSYIDPYLVVLSASYQGRGCMVWSLVVDMKLGMGNYTPPPGWKCDTVVSLMYSFKQIALQQTGL